MKARVQEHINQDIMKAQQKAAQRKSRQKGWYSGKVLDIIVLNERRVIQAENDSRLACVALLKDVDLDIYI